MSSYLLKWAEEYSSVCTAGGKGKPKGQSKSFKTQEGACKVAAWPPKRQNVVVPSHLNSTFNGNPT